MDKQRMHDLEQQIMDVDSDLGILQGKLTSILSPIGDWKIAKLQEYALAGLDAPYDINELHSKRQEVRDQINLLLEQKARIEAKMKDE